jgi:thioredoxin 1
MKNTGKIVIVVVLAAAVAATFAMRGAKRAEYAPVASGVGAPVAQASAPVAASAVPVATAARPRLLELGSLRCQACLEMAKVLDALRASQGEKLQVDFIDVFEQPDAPEKYGISLIPTQILYDGAGKEIFRHTGYFSHDDILARYRELGVRL